MSKERLIRLSGWTLMLGGVVFSWGIMAVLLDKARSYHSAAWAPSMSTTC